VRDLRLSRGTSVILAAIAVAAAASLLPWLDKPIFPDESASLYSAHLDWAALWQHTRVVDLVLLPYYSLLHLWLQLFGSIEWARLPSVLAFGLTVFVVGRLGARLGGRVCGVLAAIVAATNPLLVTAALSARPYALSALAATAAVGALLGWLEGGGVRWLWWFSVAALATLALQLFAVLVPLFVLVAAVTLKPQMFRDKWRSLVAPVGLLLAATLCFAVLAASQRSQIAWIPSPFAGEQLVRAVAGPASGEHDHYAIVVFVFAIMATALCLWPWRRGGRRAIPDLRLFAILLAWTALPTVALVAASVVKPVFLDRYVTSSAPGLAIALALLMGCAANEIAAGLGRWRAFVTSALLVIVALALFLEFSIPAARLTYHEAISQRLPDDSRLTVIESASPSTSEATMDPSSSLRRSASGSPTWGSRRCSSSPAHFGRTATSSRLTPSSVTSCSTVSSSTP
jgi:mannosyltransferase